MYSCASAYSSCSVNRMDLAERHATSACTRQRHARVTKERLGFTGLDLGRRKGGPDGGPPKRRSKPWRGLARPMLGFVVLVLFQLLVEIRPLRVDLLGGALDIPVELIELLDEEHPFGVVLELPKRLE